jgi:hypothetical protein
MNRNSLAVFAALAVAAGSSFAESYAEHNTPYASSASRTEVAAQAAAPRQGVAPWSIRFNPLDQFRSTRSRAEVTAGYLADRDVVNALTAEDSGSDYLARGTVAAQRSRLAGQPATAY